MTESDGAGSGVQSLHFKTFPRDIHLSCYYMLTTVTRWRLEVAMIPLFLRGNAGGMLSPPAHITTRGQAGERNGTELFRGGGAPKDWGEEGRNSSVIISVILSITGSKTSH